MGNKFERNDGGGDGSGSITKAHWYEEWCTIQQHAVQLVYIYYAKVILIERNNSNTFHSHEYKRGNALRMGRVKHALYDCKHWKESICFSHKLALHTRLFYGSREIFFFVFSNRSCACCHFVFVLILAAHINFSFGVSAEFCACLPVKAWITKLLAYLARILLTWKICEKQWKPRRIQMALLMLLLCRQQTI